MPYFPPMPNLYDLLANAVAAQKTATQPVMPGQQGMEPSMAAAPSAVQVAQPSPAPQGPPPAPPKEGASLAEGGVALMGGPGEKRLQVTPENHGKLRQLWDFITHDPRASAYLLNAAAGMNRPRAWGESQMQHISNGLLQGYQGLAAMRMMQAAMAEQQRKAGIEERETRIKESGAQTAAHHAANEERQVAQTGEYQRGEIAARNEANAVDRERLAAQRMHDAAQLKVEQKKADAAIAEAEFHQKEWADNLKHRAKSEEAQALAQVEEQKVRQLQIKAALASIEVEKLKTQMTSGQNQAVAKADSEAWKQATEEVLSSLETVNKPHKEIAAMITNRKGQIFEEKMKVIQAQPPQGATSTGNIPPPPSGFQIVGGR